MQELQKAYGAQGDKVVEGVDRPVALTDRASDSKSEGWGFKSLLACHLISYELRVMSYEYELKLLTPHSEL